MESFAAFVKSEEMVIELSDVSKRYSEEWILRKINLSFHSGNIYGIEGSNGSGKSTLLKILSGLLSPTLGKITYTSQGKNIDRNDIYQQVSMWGPHTGLLKHLTIDEMIRYHFTFKSLGCSSLDVLKKDMNLTVPFSRMINSLSSGQAQRLALTLTIVSQSDILLLDEPGSFLDEASVHWMNELIAKYSTGRLVVIASNETRDLVLAKNKLNVAAFS